MKLVIDIDEEHLNLIRYKVEQGNTEFTPYVIIANGKPLESVLYENSWEQHKQIVESFYKR